MATALKVQDLCKTYIVNKRQNNVLRNVEFEVEEGELVSIMGPSGSGKSTLLYCVSGMDEITSGKVCFYDKQLDQMTQEQLSDVRLTEMGFIFQQMFMLKNLSIFDNIILSAYETKGCNSKERKQINERAVELMRKTNIIEVADNDITEVSGGQLQRACICRSLINKPKMLFADEPTGSLNKQSSNEVMEEILKFNREGTTVLLVTHDVKIAAKSERVLYIVDGNIKGECLLGKYQSEETMKERRQKLNLWLTELGW